MSKYDPLSQHLARSEGAVELGFRDIEELLRFALPASARRYPAWWSNSGGTHVQAEAWIAAGYHTEDVNIGEERVRFVPHRMSGLSEMKQTTYNPKTVASAQKPKVASKVGDRHPLWGVWKGVITLDPDYDYTQPADPDWGKVYDD